MKKILSILISLMVIAAGVLYDASVIHAETLGEVNVTIVSPTAGEKSDEAAPGVSVPEEIGVTVESAEFVDKDGKDFETGIIFNEEEIGIRITLKADDDLPFDEKTNVIISDGTLLNDPVLDNNALTFVVLVTPQKAEPEAKGSEETEQTLTILWTSIDGDELKEPIVVKTTAGKTVAEAVEGVKLFEEDGYVASTYFVLKSMSEYYSEFDLYVNDEAKTVIEEDMIVYYPMIKLINEVELSLDPPVSGDETTTPEKGDGWDWVNQTNKPRISSDSDAYRILTSFSLWVDNFEDSPRNPFIGTFESGRTYNAHTVVVDNYGYKLTGETKYIIENATLAGNDDHGFIDYTVVIADAEYSNTKGAGNTWYKGSDATSDFTFKRDVHDELTYSKCEGFMVDDKTLDPENYTTEKGSIIVKLKPSYLETLSVGEHTLTALFNDGNNVEVKFYIRNKVQPVQPSYPIPLTGVE